MTSKRYSRIDLPIPLVDLKAQYATLIKEIGTAISNCVKEAEFMGSEQLEKAIHYSISSITEYSEA